MEEKGWEPTFPHSHLQSSLICAPTLRISSAVLSRGNTLLTLSSSAADEEQDEIFSILHSVGSFPTCLLEIVRGRRERGITSVSIPPYSRQVVVSTLPTHTH